VTAVVLAGVIVFLPFLELFPDVVGLALAAGGAMILFGFAVLRDLGAWKARRLKGRLVDAIVLMLAVLQGGENPRQALDTTAQACQGSAPRRAHGDRPTVGPGPSEVLGGGAYRAP
jgi:hypothetical protein